MDPVTLATTIATFLSPHLVRAGETAVDKIGEKLPEVAGRLWNVIQSRFKGNPVAEGAVTKLAARPEDQLSQGAFAAELRDLLEAEPEFAAELERLLGAAQGRGGDTIVNTGSGAVATGGGAAAGEGGTVIQGDVHGDINPGGPRRRE